MNMTRNMSFSSCVPTTAHLLELPCDARGIQPCDGNYCRRGDHMMDVEVMKIIMRMKTTGFILNTANGRWTCEWGKVDDAAWKGVADGDC